MTRAKQQSDEQREVVLLALDGSPAAATALPAARYAAQHLGAELEILHVTSRETTNAEARAQLGVDATGMREVTARVVAGDAATEILRSSADSRVALVVLTTYGGVSQAARPLGHVALAVAARAEHPILLVRPDTALRPPAGGTALRQLLVPVDGALTTGRFLPPVAKLAGRMRASLDLLYVVGAEGTRSAEPGSVGAPMYVDQPQHEWPAWEREAVHRLSIICAECAPDVPVRMFLGRDPIVDEILRFVTEHQEDAIVLVRQSHLEGERGAIIRAVLQQASCPILLVGAPDAA